MSESELQDFFDTAIKVAKKAGEIMRDAFSKEKTLSLKMNPADLVTETDKAVEKMAHSFISNKFPHHKFIGEETTAETGEKHFLTDDPTWIIDPVDGTTNFVSGIPEFAFSLGITVNKKPVIGIVYIPLKDEMFSARVGKGAHLNGKQIKVKETEELTDSVILTEGGSSRNATIIEDKVKNIHTLITHTRGFRSYGACAVNLCYVAEGRAEGYVEYGIHIWDIIAGAVIAQEAGATVLDPTGCDLDLMRRRILCACTPNVAKQLTSVMRHIEFESD